MCVQFWSIHLDVDVDASWIPHLWWFCCQGFPVFVLRILRLNSRGRRCFGRFFRPMAHSETEWHRSTNGRNSRVWTIQDSQDPSLYHGNLEFSSTTMMRKPIIPFQKIEQPCNIHVYVYDVFAARFFQFIRYHNVGFRCTSFYCTSLQGLPSGRRIPTTHRGNFPRTLPAFWCHALVSTFETKNPQHHKAAPSMCCQSSITTTSLHYIY